MELRRTLHFTGMFVMLPWKSHCLLVVPTFGYKRCALVTSAAFNCATVLANKHEVWQTEKVPLE